MAAMIRVLFFGLLAEVTACKVLDVPVQDDLEQLRHVLLERFPGLKDYTLLTAVNQEIVHNNSPLKAGDEIAFMPPFAGG